jgi:hypothetical protein
MHDLIPLADPDGTVIAYTEEHEAIRAFAANEKAASTRRAYRADYAAFARQGAESDYRRGCEGDPRWYSPHPGHRTPAQGGGDGGTGQGDARCLPG